MPGGEAYAKNADEKHAAYFLINCHIGKEDSVLEKVKNYKEVKDALMVYGSYDLIVKAETEDTGKLREFIAWK